MNLDNIGIGTHNRNGLKCINHFINILFRLRQAVRDEVSPRNHPASFIRASSAIIIGS